MPENIDFKTITIGGLLTYINYGNSPKVVYGLAICQLWRNHLRREWRLLHTIHHDRRPKMADITSNNSTGDQDVASKHTVGPTLFFADLHL
ncbi:hypothetical protein TNCV_1772941 [Trichonephila clavipes]|nr:hypothetical protein TNCV_1772941 [Trichonephila clavipes]